MTQYIGTRVCQSVELRSVSSSIHAYCTYQSINLFRYTQKAYSSQNHNSKSIHIMCNGYIRPSTGYSDCDLIWCVGRLRPVMCTSVTSTRSKVKVTEFLQFQKLHFCRSSSSAILSWSSKLMVYYDSMASSLQVFGARFMNFLLSKLPQLQTLWNVDITRLFKRAIFPYWLTLQSYGRVCW